MIFAFGKLRFAVKRHYFARHAFWNPIADRAFFLDDVHGRKRHDDPARFKGALAGFGQGAMRMVLARPARGILLAHFNYGIFIRVCDRRDLREVFLHQGERTAFPELSHFSFSKVSMARSFSSNPSFDQARSSTLLMRLA